MTRQLTKSEKQELVKEIRNYPEILDVLHNDHGNSLVVCAAWEKISKKLGRTVAECRAAWKFVKAKDRYEESKKLKLDDAQETDSNIPKQETPQKGSFKDIPVGSIASRTREEQRTLTSISKTSENNNRDEDSSNCSYTNGDPKETGRNFGSEISLEQSVEELNELTKITTSPKQQLKNYAMLSNLDNMLKDLPIDIVHELYVTFVNMTYEKIKEFNTKN